MKRGTVAIIGRPNVVKSSLFNRLSGDKLAITDDASGITRDRLYTKCEWLNQEFSIIDTGGIELKNVPFMEEIKAQAQLAIDANKIDDVKFMDNIYEFYNLGVDDVIAVSALHGIGVGDLLDKVVELLPEKKEKRYDDAVEFCIIGQPNVGKSSLTNAILGTERVIVSDIAGTTRDAIDSKFTRDGKNYVVIDTAGIRKQGKIYENAEKYSVLRAIKAIERSEVVLFVLDGTKEIEEQDKRIAGYAAEYNKAVIIVVNKWDAVDKDEKSMKEFTEKIRKNFLFISYAPIVFVSALKNQRIQTLFEQIKIVYENYNRRIATNVLNDIILDASIMNQAPIFNGDRIRVYYGSQVDIKPPTFVLFVNDPNYMHFSYQRYLENRFRSAFMLEGTPIKLILRKREN